MDTPWMTLEETAAYLRIPKATLYFWRSNSQGPKASKIGRHLRYRQSDVDAWMESCA